MPTGSLLTGCVEGPGVLAERHGRQPTFGQFGHRPHCDAHRFGRRSHLRGARQRPGQVLGGQRIGPLRAR
eukprot:5516037-Pyramimonas_sp.AAC.1